MTLGEFNATITGLTPGSRYYFRALLKVLMELIGQVAIRSRSRAIGVIGEWMKRMEQHL